MAALPHAPLPFSPPQAPDEPARPPDRPPRGWQHKFRDALRGLKVGIRAQSSFFVHFFFAALVVAAGIALKCELVQWCLLAGCVGMVLAAELFNSAIEILFRGLDEEGKRRAWPCLDVAAGAVLVASVTAAVVGGLIFLHQLAALFGGHSVP